MSYFLFVKERETQRWEFVKEMPWVYSHTRQGRFVKGSGSQKTSEYPKPEHVSPFIETHKVIQADTKGEAWNQL